MHVYHFIHIIEERRGTEERCDNITRLFRLFADQDGGSKPVYTYTLAPGITDDRHGMMIVNNEHIIEIIKNGEKHEFETDKQTLDDLNLLGNTRINSDYSLYVGTITREVNRKMEDMFLHPLTDAKSINERSAVFRYFRDHDFGFPFGKDEFDVVEQYIAGASGSVLL